MNVFQIILVIIAAAAIIGFAYQAFAVCSEKRRFLPPGLLVDVGGFRLHAQVAGRDNPGPTVILDAGMISFSSNWAWVQPEVARTAPVVAIDRAGLGWSDVGPNPRDAGSSARELHTALTKLGLPAPYVVVGHSYGGLTARAFAALYPDEVMGMVLVDASHPDQWVRMGITSRMMHYGSRLYEVLARFGVLRLFDGELKLLTSGLPPRQTAELMAIAGMPRSYRTVGNAMLVWDDLSRLLVNGAGDLGDKPLMVLSVTEQPFKGAKLTELQNELSSLSTNSLHITVQGASHEALVSQQRNALVVMDAILRVVAAVRDGQPLASDALPAEAGAPAETAVL